MSADVVTRGRRLVSAILDQFIMTVICMIFFLPEIIRLASHAKEPVHPGTTFFEYDGFNFYMFVFGLSLYFCKDNINGRSIGKRIMKLQTVNSSTGGIAHPLQYFVRNFLLILWPIELIVILVNPRRRIGDYAAGTKIVNFDPAVSQPIFRPRKLLLPLAVSYAWLTLSALPLKKLNYTFPEEKFIANSYDKTTSKSLEKLFTDSLGQYLTASALLYNKMENTGKKYLTIIFTLEKNYFEDESFFPLLRSRILELIYSRLPKDSFTGHALFSYQTVTKWRKISYRIGSPLAMN